MNVIRGPYLNDLLAQPTAVEDTLAKLGPLPPLPAFERIVLTGMGSSLAAVHPLTQRLVEHGHTAMMLDTSELIHAMKGLLTNKTLVIAVSQSGRSAEIVRLVEMKRSPILAVTNTADAPLAHGAAVTVLTHAGAETTVSCKTYVAGLAALSAVGDALCGQRDDLSVAPAAMQRYLDRWESHVAELHALVDGVRDVFFAGRGTSLGAVHTAGLIVKESARCHSEGMTSAALRHGPMEMAADHVLAIVYEGDAAVAALNRSLVSDLERAGARARVCGTGGVGPFQLEDVDSALRPFLEILPAQMLSLALAAAKGIEAGRFVHASKVTATE